MTYRAFARHVLLLLVGASIGAVSVRTHEARQATDACIQALESAERAAAVLAMSQETYEATVGAWMEARSESTYEDLVEVDDR